MKTLFLECSMGAAGDMLTAALLELVDDRQAFINRMNSLGLPGVCMEAESAVKCGITGTHVRVTVEGSEEGSEDTEHVHDHHDLHHDHGHKPEHEHSHSHHHASIADIRELIGSLAVSERVKADANAVYTLIAEAESRVHGRPVSGIHFHEVGTLDAVADVVAVCLLMEQIAPDSVIASPVHTGTGYVRCAHGILPVPAPATALLLEGIPSYSGRVEGELCTPTGAALLRHFVSHFGDRPVMTVAKIGYGMGKKDFERANCVRAFLGESEGVRESVTKLECNLDDMTGEEIGFAMDRLFDAGARDVFTQPVGMKKNRPGILLSVVCLPHDADRLAAVVMKYTTTLGIRRQDMDRYTLERTTETVSTSLGNIRVKRSSGFGITREKPEYDDLASLAVRNCLPLSSVRDQLKRSEN